MGSARTLELRPEALPAQGDLASTPFAVLLGWARANRSSGILSINGEKFVFLSKGTPVHVDSVLADETSEVYLKTRVPAATDAGNLAAAKATAEETGRGVGEAMLGLGWLDPGELFEHKKAHAREKLVSCFNPRAGTIRFEPRESFGSELLPIPLDVADAMREAFGRFYDRARLDRELPVDDLCRVSAVDGAEQASVTTEDARILQLAGSRPTMRALATAAGVRSDELKRRLYVLFCLGLVAFELGAPISEESPAEQKMAHPFPVPKAGTAPTTWSGSRQPPAAAPPPAPDPVRIPQPPPAPPTATPSPPARASAPPPRPATPVATPAPARHATPYPPAVTPSPRPRPPTTPSTRTATPSPPPRPPTTPAPTTRRTPGATARPPTPPGMTRPVRTTPVSRLTEQASRNLEAALDAAEIARANGELPEAIEILRAANRELPNEPRILAQLALTLLLFDERKFAKEANRLAREARTAAPQLALPYVVMGMLLQQIGERDQALQMYRHALAREPDAPEAARRLQLLDGGFKATK